MRTGFPMAWITGLTGFPLVWITGLTGFLAPESVGVVPTGFSSGSPAILSKLSRTFPLKNVSSKIQL